MPVGNCAIYLLPSQFFEDINTLYQNPWNWKQGIMCKVNGSMGIVLLERQMGKYVFILQSQYVK
jgi:hypothetical protein